MINSVTNARMIQECLVEHKLSLQVLCDLQIPQISVQSNICGMCSTTAINGVPTWLYTTLKRSAVACLCQIPQRIRSLVQHMPKQDQHSIKQVIKIQLIVYKFTPSVNFVYKWASVYVVHPVYWKRNIGNVGRKTSWYEEFEAQTVFLGIKFLISFFFPFYLLSIDCESHCKTSKGKMKITMKKYCKKDYGKSNMKMFLCILPSH